MEPMSLRDFLLVTSGSGTTTRTTPNGLCQGEPKEDESLIMEERNAMAELEAKTADAKREMAVADAPDPGGWRSWAIRTETTRA